MTERQEDQQLVERLQAENLAAARDKAWPAMVEDENWGDGLIQQGQRDMQGAPGDRL